MTYIFKRDRSNSEIKQLYNSNDYTNYKFATSLLKSTMSELNKKQPSEYDQLINLWDLKTRGTPAFPERSIWESPGTFFSNMWHRTRLKASRCTFQDYSSRYDKAVELIAATYGILEPPRVNSVPPSEQSNQSNSQLLASSLKELAMALSHDHQDKQRTELQSWRERHSAYFNEDAISKLPTHDAIVMASLLLQAEDCDRLNLELYQRLSDALPEKERSLQVNLRFGRFTMEDTLQQIEAKYEDKQERYAAIAEYISFCKIPIDRLLDPPSTSNLIEIDLLKIVPYLRYGNFRNIHPKDFEFAEELLRRCNNLNHLGINIAEIRELPPI